VQTKSIDKEQRKERRTCWKKGRDCRSGDKD